jgi:hypothetical protein
MSKDAFMSLDQRGLLWGFAAMMLVVWLLGN